MNKNTKHTNPTTMMIETSAPQPFWTTMSPATSSSCLMMNHEEPITTSYPLHTMDVPSSTDDDAKHDFASVVSNDLEGNDDDEAMLLHLPQNDYCLTSDSEDESSMDVSQSSISWTDATQSQGLQTIGSWSNAQSYALPTDLSPTSADYHHQLLKRFQERMQQTDQSRYMIRQSLQDSRGRYPISEAFFLHQRCLEIEASRYTTRKWVEEQIMKEQWP